MNKFIPYLQFGKINCLLCHVSKYGEYEMLHQSEDPKRKEINMIFENSVIRISNFFSNPSNSFKEGFARWKVREYDDPEEFLMWMKNPNPFSGGPVTLTYGFLFSTSQILLIVFLGRFSGCFRIFMWYII